MAKKNRARFVALTNLVAERYRDLDIPAALHANRARVDGRVITNPTAKIRADAAVRVRPERQLRGEIKLAHALDVLAVPVAGRVALDVGAAAGGFTAALLARGARRVYAVDVGFGQLTGRLRADPRVVNLERRNVAHLSREPVPEEVGVITLDLSYLAVAEVLPHLEALRLAARADLVALVKATFELDRGDVARTPGDAALAVDRARTALRRHGWQVVGSTNAPRTGRRGAVEMFVHARRTPTPHGFELAPAKHRLLRGRPAAATLEWAVASVAAGARLVAIRALPGGTSSAVHRLTIAPPTGPVRDFVLRSHVRADVVAEEPDIAAREAHVLGILEGTGVPVPRLVDIDPIGAEAGIPALLMTALPGEIRWEPIEPDGYVRGLAAALGPIHEVSPSPSLPPYRPFELGTQLDTPRWSRHRRAWERAIEVFEGPAPAHERRFIHRDYHPGNVLWQSNRVSGVVDWASASVGAAEVDVGHCRVNLVGHLGPEIADRFLDAWRAESGRRDYDPYWDIVAVIDMGACSGEPDEALDNWVAVVVSELG